jgi:hypothetical protein
MVTVKDVSDTLSNLHNFVLPRIKLLFKLLRITLGEPQIRAHQVACQGVNSIRLDLDVAFILQTVQDLMVKQVPSELVKADPSKIVTGLSPVDYSQALDTIKMECVSFTPCLIAIFGNLTLDLIVSKLPQSLKQLKRSPHLQQIHHRLQIIEAASEIVRLQGLNAIEVCREALLSQSDEFNLVSMMVTVTHLILQKRDQTILEISANSGPNKYARVSEAFKASSHSRGENLKEELSMVDADYLEEVVLGGVLDGLLAVCESKILLSKWMESQRVSLQHALFFNLLQVAGLKNQGALAESEVLLKLTKIGVNLIRSCSHSELGL